MGYLRGVQDTKRPFAVALGTAVGNLVLEVVLVYGLDQGIGASALSTVVAQTAAAATFVWWIRQAVARHDVSLRPDPTVIRRLAVAGWDLLIRTSALRASLTVTVAMAARIGTYDLAAHQIVFEVWTVLALVLDATAIAGQALIGLALGAGQPARARALGRRMIGWGLLSGVMTGAAVLSLSPVLPQVFTSDAAVVTLAAFLLLHVGFSQPAARVVFTLDGVLIGAGDLRFLAVSMVSAGAVLVSATGSTDTVRAVAVSMVDADAVLISLRRERISITAQRRAHGRRGRSAHKPAQGADLDHRAATYPWSTRTQCS